MRRVTYLLSTAVFGQAHCYGFISFSVQTECKSVFECNGMKGIEKLKNSRLFIRSQTLFVVVRQQHVGTDAVWQLCVFREWCM